MTSLPRTAIGGAGTAILLCCLASALSWGGSHASVLPTSCHQPTFENESAVDAHYQYPDASSVEMIAKIRHSAGRIIPGYHAAREGRQACGVLDLATPDAARGAWYFLDDHVVYDLDACHVRRLDGDAARCCLAGRTVTFVGDSITRHVG